MTAAPSRGFPAAEFEARCAKLQRGMRDAELDAILLTTEAHVRYFSGFLSQFWMSPTRPWYLVIPADGKPIAVIPSIGVAGMRRTWLDTIHSWSSPHPDDDGVSLLASTIGDLPRRFGRLGVPLGNESHLRMPARDFQRLRERTGLESIDCMAAITHQCSIKSEAEVDKIRHVCRLACDSFEALPDYAERGESEREVVRKMCIDLLERGVDHTPFIVSASGADGYDDIIMGPADRIIDDGDILVIDTGSVYDGYFCDFDRNFAFGHASERVRQAYRTLYRSTEAGLAAARPGVTTTEVWQAMWSVLEADGAQGNPVGRMGHGVGAQLTEWPSLSAIDHTPLEAGMVITLEPGMGYAKDKMMVHEENILITETGASLLTRRAPDELPVVE